MTTVRIERAGLGNCLGIRNVKDIPRHKAFVGKVGYGPPGLYIRTVRGATFLGGPDGGFFPNWDETADATVERYVDLVIIVHPEGTREPRGGG